MSKKILHLCADTGSDSKPYKDAGYDVWLVGSKTGVENFYPPSDVYGIIANPPCTEFSRARSGGKARLGEDGMFLVRECQRIIAQCEENLKFWVIENPATGALRKYLGKPDYEYQPWWFGSPWTKKTALWGNFEVPDRIYNKWEDMPENPDLYVRKKKDGNGNRYTGKPEMPKLHKSAYDFIPEFKGLPRPSTDAEFRSLCSQKFAQAFFEVNQ